MSYGIRNVSDGVSIVSDGVRKVSEVVRKWLVRCQIVRVMWHMLLGRGQMLSESCYMV